MSKATVRYEGALKHRTGRRRAEPDPIAPTAKNPKGHPPASRLARMLALAHHVERLVEDGALKDFAEAARRLGYTRARMSQVMGLLHLSPEVQEGILSKDLKTTERRVREPALIVHWQCQESRLLT